MMVSYLEKGILGGIRHAIGAVFRALLIGFIVGVVIMEVGGAALDHGASAAAWPQSIYFHIAAVFVGLVLGYGFAMTAAFRETIRGLRDVARGLEGDAGKVLSGGRQDVTHIVDSIEHKG